MGNFLASNQFNNSDVPKKRKLEDQFVPESPAIKSKFIEDNAGEKYYFPVKILLENETHYLTQWYGYYLSDSTWEIKDSNFEADVVRQFKIRMFVVNQIKSRCKPIEAQGFPYFLNSNPSIVRHFHLHSWEDHLNKICKQANVAPIYVENWYDDELDIKNFRFVQHNVIHKDVEFKPLKEQLNCKCSAEEYCKPKNCCSYGFKTKYSYDQVRHYANPVITECWNDCKCDIDCPARLVQRGRQFPIVLFRTSDRGWSIRAASFIPENSFVMAYYGEVINDDEADRRDGKSVYMFTISGSKFEGSKYVVDSKHIGNEARWVNNSCTPNLVALSIQIERYKDYATMAYFSVRDIQIGEELTLDYNPAEVVEIGDTSCLCGSNNCKKFI